MAAPWLAAAGVPKGLRADAQRACSPEQTLERIRPLFARIGLTRLADITGLDAIGIPVVLAVRPQAGYLSVDGGKGFTHAAALASAAMECFERHAGECSPVHRFSATYAELPLDQRLPPADLPLAKNSLFSINLALAWVWAENLADGSRVALPSELVLLERYRHKRSSVLPFHFSSNGLNSGNTRSEALVGALYEVIERDATTCTKLAWEAGVPRRRVNLATASSPDIAEVVARCRAAGVEVVVFDCTVDTDVPTFCAYLCDLGNPAVGLYHGYGTHLDPEVALLRAICEAAQGRLVFIAGSRDDAFRHHRRLYANYRDAHSILLKTPESVDLRQFGDASGNTFEEDGRTLLARLASIGLHQVLAVDLTHPELGIDVFRVVVPGLEGYMLENFAPGQRGQAVQRAGAVRTRAPALART